jgi:hypothetical protein
MRHTPAFTSTTDPSYTSGGSCRLFGLPLLRKIRDRWHGRGAELLWDLRLTLANYVADRRLR